MISADAASPFGTAHATGPAAARPASAHALLTALAPLVGAEAGAEAPSSGTEARDLEQGVWVRLLERLDDQGPPSDAVRWVRGAVRAEARRARRTARRELPYDAASRPRVVPGAFPGHDPESSPEGVVLRTERERALRAAVARTPGRCPRLLIAMLSAEDLTYREIAGELGISQGSLGPIRSRCLGCLRRMLAVEVAAPEQTGKEP